MMCVFWHSLRSPTIPTSTSTLTETTTTSNSIENYTNYFSRTIPPPLRVLWFTMSSFRFLPFFNIHIFFTCVPILIYVRHVRIHSHINPNVISFDSQIQIPFCDDALSLPTDCEKKEIKERAKFRIGIVFGSVLKK